MESRISDISRQSITAAFDTRESADLAVEHLVQKLGIDRADIFVQSGATHASGIEPSGGYALSPHEPKGKMLSQGPRSRYPRRARPGATVSMPINWTQAKVGLNPKKFTMRSVPKLLEDTAEWQDYCDAPRPLNQAIKRLERSRRKVA